MNRYTFLSATLVLAIAIINEEISGGSNSERMIGRFFALSPILGLFQNVRMLRVGNFSSLQWGRVELRGVNQKEEVREKGLKIAAGNVKQGSWVLELVDGTMILWGGEITNGFLLILVWLTRMVIGHMGLANSLARKMAGINNSSNDSDGGTIKVSVNERREAFLRASNLALTWGVKSIVDFGAIFSWSKCRTFLGGSFPVQLQLLECWMPVEIVLYNCILFGSSLEHGTLFFETLVSNYCRYNVLTWIVDLQRRLLPFLLGTKNDRSNKN
ncbi:hypothetical protein NC651_009748 [Populus alba x Populus x berolinensis]|nr:hypothetical protein NC651_009748 [Populus alba x Populus x berolinensis]